MKANKKSNIGTVKRKIPTHPLNPCQWGNAAKYWELLRRNKAFQQLVEKLKRLSKSRTDKINGMLDLAEPILDQMEATYPFAAEAATWFFEPDVARRRPPRRKPSKLDPKAIKFWMQEYGWNPGLPSAQRKAIKKKVHELLTFVPEISGVPARIGPHMNEKQAEELLAWEKAGNRFSCELTWMATPPLFRERFEGLWRRSEPDDAGFAFSTAPCETQFFQGWSLGELLSRYAKTVKLGNELISSDTRPIIESRRTKGGQSMNKELRLRAAICETEEARALEFEELSTNYRVFCFPKGQRVTGELIRKTFDGWRDELLKEKKPKSDTMGSATQWYILLTVEDAMREGLNPDEALKWSYLLYNEMTRKVQREGNAFLRRLYMDEPHVRVVFKGDGRWPSWQRDFEAMGSTGNGSGWIHYVFSALEKKAANSC